MDKGSMDRLLKLALDAGFAQAEVFASEEDSFSVSVSGGQIEDYHVEKQAGVSLRGLLGGKMGYACTEDVSDDGLTELVAMAAENARLIQSDDVAPLHDGSDAIHPIKKEDKIASVPAARKIEMALALEKKALAADPRVKSVESAFVGSSRQSMTLRNTLGLDRQSSASIAYAYVLPIIADGQQQLDGFASQCADDFDALDLDAIAKEAVEEATSRIGQSSMPSCTPPVILRNDMARTLLSVFAGVFSGEAAEKGLSLLKGREGQRIAAPCVILLDDPFCDKAFAGGAFDGEGVATHAKAVIDGGIFTGLLHNLKSAAKAGVPSTGNASRGSYKSTVGIAPSNFYIKPSETSVEELCQMAGDGVMITALMGMHSGCNAISGDFSMGAKGFLIKDGKIDRPVEQITLSGNFFKVLEGVRAVASDLRFSIPGSSSFGAPSVLVDGLSIAGK